MAEGPEKYGGAGSKKNAQRIARGFGSMSRGAGGAVQV